MYIKRKKNEKIYLRDYKKEFNLFSKRIVISLIILLLSVFIIVIKMYRLQINDHLEYWYKSERNRIKLIPLRSIRGEIYDRNGIPLATNRAYYQLELVPEEAENLQKIFKDLKKLIDLNEEDIRIFYKTKRRSRKFTSIPIKRMLNEQQIFCFLVNQHQFPGVKISKHYFRYYPYGQVLTHSIGYVSGINEKDLGYLENHGSLNNYFKNDTIGRIGMERRYENILRGKLGYRKVEINRQERIMRQLEYLPPEPGSDIYTTIDLKLQVKIQKLLTNNKASVIVADPRNGEILALVSNPTYDPNLFIKGISNQEYQLLLENKDHPFINRTIQGLYPPASTAKPFIAIAALSEKIIDEKFTIFDNGCWKLPNSEKKYRDWKREGHGLLNISQAIIESSDTFFYYLAHRMGIDLISDWMKKFGYGKFSGIDLFEEHLGNMPSKSWKMQLYKKPWYQGDTISIGIGQGYWTATPIQMMKALLILINDGIIKSPHLLHGVSYRDRCILNKQNKFEKIEGVDIAFWRLVKESMHGVSHHFRGTAYSSFLNVPYKTAIKSGTAQVFSYETYNIEDISENLRDHKLMIGFAPYENPTVSVMIVLENYDVEQQLAIGKIARIIFDHFLVQDLSESSVFPEKNIE
ncbi:penicillin-binding protein 2 [Candidatus Riesia pediculicola]|uniref:Peptidoglycan D,D-transpeptidase MrdA n=1 Tax=Riesia pediculicola (strain USDA) TaxID=515618 RepID=D4G7P7_RIEPU|nr:penicillin-binding protein 2 [Candidatus Riesia pediculicola]ADD79654.1 penicillin-binding protein 2 [Candidatus Riesia pediculicola USDA]ARC53622.1 penicillin-binding protein 2 [Candidatus Riesia pediculicola]QOJ86273.1 penicillin-binding protein 2 [Candidatus Riesia pediculicola]